MTPKTPKTHEDYLKGLLDQACILIEARLFHKKTVDSGMLTDEEMLLAAAIMHWADRMLGAIRDQLDHVGHRTPVDMEKLLEELNIREANL